MPPFSISEVDNNIVVSHAAAGHILFNGRTVAVKGGAPTVVRVAAAAHNAVPGLYSSMGLAWFSYRL